MRGLSILLLAACSEPARFNVIAGPDSIEAMRAFAESVPALVVQPSGSGIEITLDLDCGDCYQVDVLDGARARVHGGSLLGVQYGLAQLLEDMGYRFYHPQRIHSPSEPKLPKPSTGKLRVPEKTLRGLHLHTLHPVEAYWDFWENGDGYRRVIDWLVKNRGNYLEWPAMSDTDRDGWREHTQAILDYARLRGITTGVGLQLFDSGNLQHAYSLISDASGDTVAQTTDKLRPMTELPFDKIALSFGEFFGEAPDVFVKQVNIAYDALQSLRPGMEMTALVHVGNRPEQHVQYMGMDLLYFFLVQYANPAIVPWIHTVMYYDLFEDTNGAYNHSDFSLHRQYLMDRINAGERAAYQPESAYWVAFDNSVPFYLPVYMYTRWLDLERLGPPLKEHVLFSTGWEWGYWQNDYLTLRLNFQQQDWRAAIDEMLAPVGGAAQVEELAMLQHDALIGKRLAAYLAGNDFLLDAAVNSGFTSQPRRVPFADVANTPDFVTTVLEPLEQFASDLSKLKLDSHDPFASEIADGLALDAARAKFVSALYRAVVDHGSTSAAAAAYADAKKIVARRHGKIDKRLLTEGQNSTIYHYGYLYYADTLCYWERERLEAANVLGETTEAPPGCVLGF